MAVESRLCFPMNTMDFSSKIAFSSLRNSSNPKMLKSWGQNQ